MAVPAIWSWNTEGANGRSAYTESLMGFSTIMRWFVRPPASERESGIANAYRWHIRRRFEIETIDELREIIGCYIQG